MRGNWLRKNRQVFVITAIAGLMLGGSAAHSQNAAASIEGRVLDTHGLSVAESVITLRGALSGEKQERVTTAEGRYSFSNVAPAPYILTVHRDGFTDQVRFVQIDRAAVSLNENFDLRIEGIRQSVTVVSGSRVEELQQQSAVTVDAVTREQMRDTGYERVTDILSEIPGVLIRSGSTATVGAEQIEGVDSRQVLVWQDGLPVVGARGIKSGIINLNRQNIGRLERVEVAKGAASALYGSEAMGGVINMITREPSDPLNLDLTLSGGTLGAFDGRIGVGTKWNKLWLFTDLERHQQDSYGLIPNSPSTVGPDYQRNDGLAKARYAFSDRVSLGVSASAYHNHQTGLTGSGTAVTLGTSNDSTQAYTVVGDFLPTLRTTVQVRAYAASYDENSYSDIVGTTSPTFGFANLNERYHRLDSTISEQIGGRQLLQGGVEWAQDLYRGANRLVGDNTGQQVTTKDVWIQDRIQLFRKLTLTLGGRYQHHSLYGSHVVPKAGLVYRVSDRWSARASYGKGFRAPDIGQLYYRFANPSSFYQVIGNPNLHPESSQSFSFGGSYQRNRYRLGMNFYRHTLNNLIDSYAIGTPQTSQELANLMAPYGIPLSFDPLLNRLTFIYLNLNRAYTKGVEVNSDVAIFRRLHLEGAYSFLQAVDRATGLSLPQRHRHNGYLKLDYNNPRLGISSNLRGTFFSKWPVNPATGTFGYGYQIWDAYVSKSLLAGIESFIAVDNLADSRDQKLRAVVPSFDRADYGRTFRVGIRYTLARREK